MGTVMAQQHLETYLNDHLAGAVTALELLDYLEKEQGGRILNHSLTALRADIAEDRKHLEDVMRQCGVSASLGRRAVAWLAGKVAEVKLRTDDPDRGALLLLEALDTLSIGIEGKRLLWRALAAAGFPHPPGADYAALERRAEEQRGRVEEIRLEGARAALAVDEKPASPGGGPA
jgi:hypothetical protein